MICACALSLILLFTGCASLTPSSTQVTSENFSAYGKSVSNVNQSCINFANSNYMSLDLTHYYSIWNASVSGDAITTMYGTYDTPSQYDFSAIYVELYTFQVSQGMGLLYESYLGYQQGKISKQNMNELFQTERTFLLPLISVAQNHTLLLKSNPLVQENGISGYNLKLPYPVKNLFIPSYYLQMLSSLNEMSSTILNAPTFDSLQQCGKISILNAKIKVLNTLIWNGSVLPTSPDVLNSISSVKFSNFLAPTTSPYNVDQSIFLNLLSSTPEYGCDYTKMANNSKFTQLFNGNTTLKSDNDVVQMVDESNVLQNWLFYLYNAINDYQQGNISVAQLMKINQNMQPSLAELQTLFNGYYQNVVKLPITTHKNGASYTISGSSCVTVNSTAMMKSAFDSCSALKTLQTPDELIGQFKLIELQLLKSGYYYNNNLSKKGSELKIQDYSSQWVYNDMQYDIDELNNLMIKSEEENKE